MAVSPTPPRPDTAGMDLSGLTAMLTRRRTTTGSCSTCGATVFGDESHLRLHGVLVHRRCVGYRRRVV